MTATAKIIAHSIGPHGRQICTMVVRYWRAMHGELMTHRVFSRNASSSRAIPVAKMLRQVWSDPAGPQHWGSNRPGMQATTELTGWRLLLAKLLWSWAAKSAAFFSWAMMRVGLHKQVANRVTEPYQYITVLVTSTEWENFYQLRRHSDAQPEMQQLAEVMYRAQEASTPEKLANGQWHMPFVSAREYNVWGLMDALRMSTARNARVSYLNHDQTAPEPQKDFKLHDDLVCSSPMHASPTEHAAQCMELPTAYANFTGFRSYRRCIESGTIMEHGRMRPIYFGAKKV
jgi:hypothetical protein